MRDAVRSHRCTPLLLCVFLSAAILQGCTSARVISYSEALRGAARPLRVYQHDGRIFTLTRFAVTADGISGIGTEQAFPRNRPFAGRIQRTSIFRLETDASANSALLPLSIAGGSLLLWLVLTSESSPAYQLEGW